MRDGWSKALELYPITGIIRVQLFLPGAFLGFGPGFRSRAKYSLTASTVVTQFRPIRNPHISPSLTIRLKWSGDSPLISAALLREINSSRRGW